MNITHLLATSTIAALLAGGSVSVAQQERPSQHERNAPPTSAPELSEQKLSAAAEAIKRVAELQEDYRQRVAEADAPADKERVVAEARNELTKAVTDQGLSVDEYASILEAARDNPEIRGKILQ